MSVGIYGIGAYLPEEVRTNDWWAERVRESWRERSSGKLDRPADHAGELATEGGKLVLEAMERYRDDPFKGSRERRVMPDGMRTSEMEIAAARQAIERAGVPREEIDFVLATTSLPDYLMVPNACRIHDALGLPSNSFALQTEGVCNAFLMQLSLAEQMIEGGRARYGLLVQSSGTTRFMRPEDPMSAWFGDGATAVVVGEVADGYGVLGRSHQTHGRMYEGLVCGIPGKRWHDEGRPHAYIERPELSRELLVVLMNESRTLIHGALAEAGLSVDDVDFYACHQGFAWLRAMTQQLAGLTRAATLDTFPLTASILGANIPLILMLAEQDGLLEAGDVVATFGGAAGASLSSLVFRWGRGSGRSI